MNQASVNYSTTNGPLLVHFLDRRGVLRQVPTAASLARVLRVVQANGGSYPQPTRRAV